MKVLVACECSGTVTEAFARAGHTVMSCDLKPSQSLEPHYQGDVFDIIDDGWDMMIAFPPCTFLCKAQLHRCVPGTYYHNNLLCATDFVKELFSSNIPRIAIENPVGYLNTNWRSPTQIAYPYRS